MVERMVPYIMPALYNHAENFGMLAHIIPNHKECRFYPISVKHIQNPGCHFGNRSVVECQVNTFGGSGNPPCCAGEKEPVKKGRLLNEHGIDDAKSGTGNREVFPTPVPS